MDCYCVYESVLGKNDYYESFTLCELWIETTKTKETNMVGNSIFCFVIFLMKNEINIYESRKSYEYCLFWLEKTEHVNRTNYSHYWSINFLLSYTKIINLYKDNTKKGVKKSKNSLFIHSFDSLRWEKPNQIINNSDIFIIKS